MNLIAEDIAKLTLGRRRFLFLGKVFVCVLLSRHDLYSQRTPGNQKKYYFNVPSGKAVMTLRLAVKQGRVELVMSAEVAKGVETNSIEGSFTPLEALQRMLKDTELVVEQHDKSSVFTVKRSEKTVTRFLGQETVVDPLMT